GDILFNYISGATPNGATVSIQNTGSSADALQVALNSSTTTRTGNGQAIRFSTQNLPVAPIGALNTYGYNSLAAFALAPGNPNSLTPGGNGVVTLPGAGDDSYDTITFTGTDAFRFYGTLYNSMNMVTNGYITFGGVATTFSAGTLGSGSLVVP